MEKKKIPTGSGTWAQKLTSFTQFIIKLLTITMIGSIDDIWEHVRFLSGLWATSSKVLDSSELMLYNLDTADLLV